MTKKEKQVFDRYFEDSAMRYICCSPDDIEQLKVYRAEAEMMVRLKADLEKVNIEVGA